MLGEGSEAMAMVKFVRTHGYPNCVYLCDIGDLANVSEHK